MKISDDLATVHALRGDVALQISRFVAREKLSQARAAKLLRIPPPTLDKIVSGRVSGLSLDLLMQIAVRAGLQLVLQIGAVPEEAGAFLGCTATSGRATRSLVADDARDELLTLVQDLTPEQRLQAHLEHNELVHALYRAGRRSRTLRTVRSTSK